MNAIAHGGGAMALLGLISIALYALLAHRSWLLWGPVAGAVREPSAGLGVIRALIGALPLLGLLASVGGISDTFRDLAIGPQGSAAHRAGAGIGVALAATQAGLLAAIPAVAWERLLARRAAVLRDLRTDDA